MHARRHAQMDRQGKSLAIRMEVEANEFSSLILMPPPIWQKSLRKLRDPNIQQVYELARGYEVSKDAAARAYAQYHWHLATPHNMARPARGGGGIGRQDFAGDEPIANRTNVSTSAAQIFARSEPSAILEAARHGWRHSRSRMFSATSPNAPQARRRNLKPPARAKARRV